MVAAPEWVICVARYGRFRGREAFFDGEVDDLVEAGCLGAGAGLLGLLVAEDGMCLVEVFLAAARVEWIPPVSDRVYQGVLGAVDMAARCQSPW